jgi:hypothetical protein
VCITTGGSSQITNPFFAGNKITINLSIAVPGQANPVNAVFNGNIVNAPGGVKVMIENPIFTYSKDGIVFNITLPGFVQIPACASGCHHQEVKLFGNVTGGVTGGGSVTPIPEPATLLMLAGGLGLIARQLKKGKSA